MNQVLERLALQQLHGDEGPAVRFVDLMNRADVGVIQRRGGSRFTFESFQRLRIAREFFRQELQRDVATELEVFRFVHHAHAAAPELFQDAIVGDGLPDHG